MFTGLVETVGRIVSVTVSHGGTTIAIETPLAAELALGDSVSVNGVCLTVAAIEPQVWRAAVGPETMRVTTLGTKMAGDLVNLERSMRADSRFGGHFVQGHVDATGRVEALRHDGDSRWLSIGFPAALAHLIVAKGAVAIDGISLTVAALRSGAFDVMIVPFTWEHTNLRSLQVGDSVNLECDMIGKYVARAVELALAGRGTGPL
jgi:riboflavin synthase